MIEPVTWLIKRNGSASPRHLACVFVSLGAISFAFGAGFAALGYWMVFPFVGLELAAVAAAFMACARHAADFERIEIGDAGVMVERHEGARRSEVRFDLPWVRVEVVGRGVGVGSRVQVDVVSKRQRVEVGRYLVDARRMALARELRAALANVEGRSGGNGIRG